MAVWDFTNDKTEDLETALKLYSQLSELQLNFAAAGAIENIINELNNRGVEVQWSDYFD